MQPQTLDHVMLALADPTRRAILDRLQREGEARVTDLAAPFAVSLNAVSKHIRLLERASLVRRRRSGREHFLSFNPAPLDEAAAWIEEKRAFWTKRLDALERALVEDDAAKQRLRKGRKR
ncbi:ArsR/SmtB family transcription factor [Amphiplicatus metriothermophilus]|uniref:Transcriptional regulator, ArsR family n=1 Tax=Amphiplicatus metriothermophilus TaxID=1519374 RepID=A0A239PRC7_9PROT|nr:metalloregulator ArsR/SmtB family transcription factor [Amphiplicatus metriothermophilus]MBB5518574.1 DNA-binding transcriptional ArsR family regulator [Amphiplicatus metriothermophilus]SNT72267.1 transcriptional regulator, ArsR family [Amphiplicatus metriothermophilus]